MRDERVAALERVRPARALMQTQTLSLSLSLSLVIHKVTEDGKGNLYKLIVCWFLLNGLEHGNLK